MSAEITMPTIDQGTDVDVWQRLAEPFDTAQIGKKPKGKARPGESRQHCGICGGYHEPSIRVHLDFVGHAVVTDRLNRIVGPGNWSYEIERVVESGGHVQAVMGRMTILGRTIGLEVGEPERQSNYGDELKAAISDYIRRAAMRFGVALDLWARGELESTTRTTPEATTAPETGADTQPRAASQPPRGKSAAAPTSGQAVESFDVMCRNRGLSAPAALRKLRYGRTSGALPEEFPLLASLEDARRLEGDLLAHAASYLDRAA